MLSFISPLQVAQHVSGNRVPVFRSWRLRSVIATCWYCSVAAGRLSKPVGRLRTSTAQYQHVAITPRSRQFLKMGTWLPETCWATCKREIKDNTKVTSSWFFLSTLNYDARSTTHQIWDCLKIIDEDLMMSHGCWRTFKSPAMLRVVPPDMSTWSHNG